MKRILIFDKDIEMNMEKFYLNISNSPLYISFARSNTIQDYIPNMIFDAVILDKDAFGDDFQNLIRTIKGNSANTCVFVTTSNGNIESFIQTINCGAYEYFNKPFDPLLFQRAISTALNTMSKNYG